MALHREFGYADYAKWGAVLGASMVLAGAAGHLLLPLVFGPLPEWENVLFTDLEALGIVVGLVSVFGFGIVGPLVE